MLEGVIMTDSLNKRPGSWERSYSIEIDRTTKRHLSFFAANELEYYNRLISDVTMRLRAFPQEIIEMRGPYEELWNSLAFSNQNPRKLGKTKLSSWPRALREAAAFLPIVNGYAQLEDRKLLIFDVLSENGRIHPVMRRNLASALIKTAIAQADVLLQSQKSSTGQMRNAVQMLLPADPAEKRHLQLSRDLIDLRWHKDANHTAITIPYTDRPLIINDHNITDEKFTMIAVRPMQLPEGPWQVILYNAPVEYLLDLRDPVYHMRRT
jgi:hypothetical protein